MKHIKLFENWQNMGAEEYHSDGMDQMPADAGDTPIDQMTRPEMLDYLGLADVPESAELTDEQLRDAVRERAAAYGLEESADPELEEGMKVPDTWQFTPAQFDFLRRHGVKVSMSGDELFFPELLVLQLTASSTDSPVKQEFKDTVPMGDSYLASQILTSLKKLLGRQGIANLNGMKYYVLKGHMTRNGNFNFPNPYRNPIS